MRKHLFVLEPHARTVRVVLLSSTKNYSGYCPEDHVVPLGSGMQNMYFNFLSQSHQSEIILFLFLGNDNCVKCITLITIVCEEYPREFEEL